MKYSDLCTEVAALGFETEVEADGALLHAAERAMRMIYTERPVYGVTEIYKPPVTPTQKISDLFHRGGTVDTLPFDARSFTFRASGTGECRITDGAGERTLSFSGDGVLVRGFVYGEGRMELLGEYSYAIYGLAFYDTLFGPSEEDIPTPDELVEYDAKRYTGPILSFTSPPKDGYGNPIEGALAFAGRIRIPNTYTGRVRLEYKKAPPKIDTNPDTELMLPDGCEHLLPLLTAAYVWLDDDSDKAQYYMALYREAMTAVKLYDRTMADTGYRSVNGWA